MISLDLAQKRLIINLLKIAAIIIFISSFAIDLENTLQYGGIDLRTRVVGARLLANGQDPYYFSWEKGQSDTFLDPLDRPGSGISRVTVPPNILTLHSAISSYSYINQKIIWLVIEWSSFLATLYIFLRKSNSLYNKLLVLVIGLVFINSHFWRLHVERGQIYIIYILFWAIAWYVMSKPLKLNYFLSGLIIGFTASLRPLTVLIMIPFLIYRKLSVLLGSILGLAVGVSLPLMLSNHSIWSSYFSAISQTRHYISGYSASVTDFNRNQAVNTYPKIIEGLDNLTKTKDIPSVNSSFLYLMNRLEINEFNKNIILMLVAFVLILFFIVFIFNVKKVSERNSLLLGILICLTTDFFIPSPRYSYADIQWILPLLIVFSQADIRRFSSNPSIIFLLMGFVLSIKNFLWIPYFLQICVVLISLSTIFLSLKFIAEYSKDLKSLRF